MFAKALENQDINGLLAQAAVAVGECAPPTEVEIAPVEPEVVAEKKVEEIDNNVNFLFQDDDEYWVIWIITINYIINE